VTPADRWLTATWELVRSHLPAAPARVADVGCGSSGGFVPMLRESGYDAVGIDPQAPDGAHYLQVEFERADLPRPLDAVIASTSLHHVDDPAQVVERMAAVLGPGGIVVVVEWASERFNEKTARWCFERLAEEGWLQKLRDEWLGSGLDWPAYFRGWLDREHLHSGETLVRVLDDRLERRLLECGPYFFPDLAETSEEEERAAISAGRIEPNRIEYVGLSR
jgi:SAM-dependent methyltransferase